jgi:hypothetical protein
MRGSRQGQRSTRTWTTRNTTSCTAGQPHLKRRGFVTLLAGATLGYRLNVRAQQTEAIRTAGPA